MLVDVQKLGTILRELRGDLTQAEAARRAKIPPHTLARYERGEVEKPEFADIARLSQVYGVSLEGMAYLAGVGPKPEEDPLPADVARQVRVVRDVMLGLDPEWRAYLSERIEEQIKVLEFRMSSTNAKQQKTEKRSIVPDWVSQKRQGD